MSEQDKEMEAATKSISYDGATGVISFTGVEIGGWNDEAHIDYPEDLTWSRTIGGLCADLFKAGWKAASERKDAVIEGAGRTLAIMEAQNEDLQSKLARLEALIVKIEYLERDSIGSEHFGDRVYYTMCRYREGK